MRAVRRVPRAALTSRGQSSCARGEVRIATTASATAAGGCSPSTVIVSSPRSRVRSCDGSRSGPAKWSVRAPRRAVERPFVDRQVHEDRVVDAVAEDGAVLRAQRGAGEHGAHVLPGPELVVEATQPGDALAVIEPGTAAHARDAGRVVVVVGVEERQAEPGGDERADGRLAGARRSHDHDRACRSSLGGDAAREARAFLVEHRRALVAPAAGQGQEVLEERVADVAAARRAARVTTGRTGAGARSRRDRARPLRVRRTPRR